MEGTTLFSTSVSVIMASKRPRASDGSTITILDSAMKDKTPKSSRTPAPPRKKTEIDNSHKSSWVWQHFKTERDEVSKETSNICQAIIPSQGGKICGRELKVDSSGSTKSMARHLKRRHHMYEDTVVERGSMKSFVTNGNLQSVS